MLYCNTNTDIMLVFFKNKAHVKRKVKNEYNSTNVSKTKNNKNEYNSTNVSKTKK